MNFKEGASLSWSNAGHVTVSKSRSRTTAAWKLRQARSGTSTDIGKWEHKRRKVRSWKPMTIDILNNVLLNLCLH